MKKTLFFLLIFSSVFFFSQEKKKFTNTEAVLKSIKPTPSIDFWCLVYNTYSRDKVIKTEGISKMYLPQFSGFTFSPNDSGDSFYYIAYSKAGKIEYITQKEQLKNFIGSIDNGEEAALIGLINGYFLDEEYKDLAANYYSKPADFVVELAKVTSEKCPFQKSHFALTINKKSGEITSVKNFGNYVEVYAKTCENNPHNEELKKQMEEAAAKKKKEPKRSAYYDGY